MRRTKLSAFRKHRCFFADRLTEPVNPSPRAPHSDQRLRFSDGHNWRVRRPTEVRISRRILHNVTRRTPPLQHFSVAGGQPVENAANRPIEVIDIVIDGWSCIVSHYRRPPAVCPVPREHEARTFVFRQGPTEPWCRWGARRLVPPGANVKGESKSSSE